MKKRLLLTLLLTITLAPVARAARPNIVFIMADDLGYGDVSVLNPKSKIPTPNLDRLAKSGMIFTDAHSGSSVCTPTRYGVLTGRYCWRSRLKRSVLYGYSNSLMDPHRTTVASLLKSQGYRSGMIGKWHLGLDWANKSGSGKANRENEVDFAKPFGNGPTVIGFDYFYGISASLDMPPYVYLENDRAVTIPTVIGGGKKFRFGRDGLSAEGLLPVDVLTDFTTKTIEFINRQTKDHPFFLYVPLAAPHTPLAPTDRFRGKSPIGRYGEFCMDVDYSVGQILAALDKQGFTDNTLVLFTSDNGCAPYVGVKDFEKKGHFPSYIYRGYKADIFDGGHRVPFIARWPGVVKPASTSSQIICHTDLLATAADITGQDLSDNAGEDSLSFLPALQGGSVDTARRAAIVNHSINGTYAIRKGKWKLIFGPGSGGWGSPKDKAARKQGLPEIQLYDMRISPDERTNLQAEFPAVVKQLTELMAAYAANGRSTAGKVQANEPAGWGKKPSDWGGAIK